MEQSNGQEGATSQASTPRMNERVMTPGEAAFGFEPSTEALVWVELDGVGKGSFKYKGGFLDDEINRHCGGSGDSEFLVLLHDWEDGIVGRGTKGIRRRFFRAVDGPPRTRADAAYPSAPAPTAAPAPAAQPDVSALVTLLERRAENAEQRAAQMYERMNDAIRELKEQQSIRDEQQAKRDLDLANDRVAQAEKREQLERERAEQERERAEKERERADQQQARLLNAAAAPPRKLSETIDELTGVLVATNQLREQIGNGGAPAEKPEPPSALEQLAETAVPRVFGLLEMGLGLAMRKAHEGPAPTPPKAEPPKQLAAAPAAPATTPAQARVMRAPDPRRAAAPAAAAPPATTKAPERKAAPPKKPKRKEVRGRLRGR